MQPPPPFTDADAPAADARWSLRLLDHFSLRGPEGDAGLTARKAIALLVFLALQRDRLARRDTIANMLWSGVDTGQGRVSLRQAIAAIRRVEGATPILVTQPDTIALAAAVDVDVETFARLARGTLSERAAAADLYRTDLVAGFTLRDEPAFNEWLAITQAHWRLRAIDVLLSLAEAALATSGDGQAGIAAALKLLAIDPFNEAGHRILMRLYARQGRAALALAQYRGLADLLRRELQVSPDSETQALFEELKSNRRQPRGERAPPAVEPTVAAILPDPQDEAVSDQPLAIVRAPRRRWPWMMAGTAALLLASGGYALWRVGGQLWDRVPAITRVYPIAAGENDERQPALSPDGTLVVYRLRRDGVAHLYLSAIEGNGAEPVQLTRGTASNPVWRPDGRAIAFIRQGADEAAPCAIFVRPVPIGQEQQVGRCTTSASTSLSWSADAQTLYFDDEASPRFSRRIYALRVADGTVRPVTAATAVAHGDYHPLVSHDGTRLAFLRLRDSASDLIVQDLASGVQTVVRRDVVGLWGLSWSEGDRGLFYTILDGSQAGLWWAPLREDGRPARLSSGVASYNIMSASSSGKRLAIQVAQRRSDFLRLPRGATAAVATTLPGFAANDFDRGMTEARDGSIAFVTTRSGSEQLMLTRPGQAPRTIAAGQATAFSWLAWSPDGRRLAAAATANGKSNILVIDIATGKVRALTSGDGFDNYPAWSADGRHLYWSSLRNAGSALVRVAIADPGRIEPVARDEFGIVRFASNGRAIYYTLLGKPGIWRQALTVDGRLQGPATLVVRDLSGGSPRAWVLTDDAIFFRRTNADRPVELCRHDLKSGQTSVIVTAADDQTTFQPYVTADGGILIERLHYQNDLTGIDVE